MEEEAMDTVQLVMLRVVWRKKVQGLTLSNLLESTVTGFKSRVTRDTAL
jgi:hypothetical protein